MRYPKIITLSSVLFVSGVVMASSLPAGHGNAEAQSSAQDKAGSLRLQLSEVETKQAELQTRLQQLDEGMKTENIERSLAGVGSTRPEELREQRRRQLEIERNGVKAQLDILAKSHTRLETAIARTDAEAYRQSAAPVTVVTPSVTGAPAGGPSSEPTNEVAAPTKPRRVRKKKRTRTKRAHHAHLVVLEPEQSRGVSA